MLLVLLSSKGSDNLLCLIVSTLAGCLCCFSCCFDGTGPLLVRDAGIYLVCGQGRGREGGLHCKESGCIASNHAALQQAIVTPQPC
jgi:hypothetical protein